VGEPASSLSDHSYERDAQVGFVECLNAAQSLHIVGCFAYHGIDHVVDGCHADHPALVVNHGKRNKIVLRDQPGGGPRDPAAARSGAPQCRRL